MESINSIHKFIPTSRISFKSTSSGIGGTRILTEKDEAPLPGSNTKRVAIIITITVVFVAIIIAAMFLISPAAPKLPAKPPQTLNISGSTTIQPVSESLANAYTLNHPDVKIKVEGGGSGAGIQKVGQGLTDLGSSSRNLNPDELVKYPDLQGYKIGGSAVVVIVDRNYPADQADKNELLALYDDKSEDISNLTHLSGIRTVIQRSDDSGTEETFAQWINPPQTNLSPSMQVTDYAGASNVTPLAVAGNEAVVMAVVNHPNSIGFADFGFAEREPGVKILKLRDSVSGPALPANISTARESIRLELNRADGNNTYYISKMTRPLLYITKGAPSPLESDFISFAQSKESQKYFDDVGYFSITEFSNNKP